jgi:hypothetical protein
VAGGRKHPPRRKNTNIHQQCFIIPELIIGDFLLITGIELKNSGGWKKNTRHGVRIKVSEV